MSPRPGAAVPNWESDGFVGMTYGSLRAANRGGGFYSDQVSDRLGSLLARLIGPNLHPAAVTLANLLVGTASSALAMIAVNSRPSWLVGIVALVGWQLAYGLDCADGQIARATNKTTEAGRRLDVLCDLAVQTTVVAAIAVIATAHHPHLPVALPALFAASWMVNMVVFLLCSGDNSGRGRGTHSLLRSEAPIVASLKLPRDYGFAIILFGAALAFWRTAMYWLMVGYTVFNFVFLAASIVNEARLSVIASRRPAEQHVEAEAAV